MSKTVILADKTELTALEVSGATQYIQGNNRDALTFIFPASEGMETLDAAFTAEKCETFVTAFWQQSELPLTDDVSENCSSYVHFYEDWWMEECPPFPNEW